MASIFQQIFHLQNNKEIKKIVKYHRYFQNFQNSDQFVSLKKLFKERDFQKPEGSGKGSMVYTFVITYIVHFKSVHLTPCELYLGEGNGNPLQYSVLLPGESHGWRSLVGCSPWGSKNWT